MGGYFGVWRRSARPACGSILLLASVLPHSATSLAAVGEDCSVRVRDRGIGILTDALAWRRHTRLGVVGPWGVALGGGSTIAARKQAVHHQDVTYADDAPVQGAVRSSGFVACGLRPVWAAAGARAGTLPGAGPAGAQRTLPAFQAFSSVS